MKKVLTALLAVFCLYSLAFAINPKANPNADIDKDYAEKMAAKALLKSTPTPKIKGSGIPLATGDYYIPKGSNALGFDSLHIAVDSINANGVVGIVNLILDADTLREPSFTFNADLSADSNVVVKPATGRDVVLIVAPGASQGNGPQMIGFETGYVTFDGSNDGTDSSRNLIVTSEGDADVPFGFNGPDADFVTIKNLIIKNLDNGVVSFRYGVVTNDVGGQEDILIENCQIATPEFPVRRYGIAIWGDWTYVMANTSVLNCEINAGAGAIENYLAGNGTYINNTFNLYPSAAAKAYCYGIRLSWAHTTEIRNNVFNLAEEKTAVAASQVRGIKIYSNPAGAVFSIVNNTFNLGAADETAPVSGIEYGSSNNARNSEIYHNTFVLNDNVSTSACNVINKSTSGPAVIDLKNNIIINKHTGNTASSAISLGANAVLTSNSNILVSDQNCVTYDGTSYADLADWKIAGQDANSDSLAVTFASATDLHLAAPSNTDQDLIVPRVPGVDTDIDGDVRPNVSFAFAGADEGDAGTIYPDYDIDEDFTDTSDVANWRSDNAGWTSRTHVDTVLQLSDAGWTIDARCTVKAIPNSFFMATASIKTGSFDTSPSQFLTFGVEGIASEKMEVSCISEDGFTTYSVIGFAENTEGTLFINGQGAGGADTVWVDEYTYQNNYIPALTKVSTIGEARTIADGDKAATIGIVTTTTNYGYSGPVYIQDATAGIAVYNSSVAQNAELGDEILVVGEIDIYNGLVEIKNTDFTVLSKDNEVVPIEITAADMNGEAYEGMLVTIIGCDTLDTGLSWAATEGSNKGFSLKDGEDSTFYCYIDKDTDIDGSEKPAFWPQDITGIVGDYNGAQLLPRSLADFKSSNMDPSAFTIVSPTDSTVITSFEDPNIMKVLVGTDSLYTLCVKWTEAVDPDTQTVTYQVMISPEGPEEDQITLDTIIYIPLDNKRPWSMNGSYNAYVVARDSLDGMTYSDTVILIFDFPTPPEIIYADIVLVDGAPKLYAMFNMEFEAVEIANFSIVDQFTMTATAPTALDSLDSVTVMLSGDLVEDNYIELAYSGITAPGGTVTATDTAYAGQVLIPFSEIHPEDAINIITDFESDVGSFLAPNWSGSTTADGASTFEVSDEEAYRGAKSGKMTIVDKTDTEGGWYVRELYGYPFAYTVQTTSKLMFMVKGTDVEVEMRLSITENPGYEQGPWTRVSVSEDDWQVVSFDLANDVAEGWVNGNGIVEGETVEIEGIHIRCAEDKDVVLYIDEFTERPSYTEAVTFNTLPEKFALHQNYPNPFNPTTNIQFDLPKAVDVKLVIYDIMGRKITTLVNTHMEAGYKNIVWNGTNDYGNKISSGIYIYRIIAGNNIKTMKMSYIK